MAKLSERTVAWMEGVQDENEKVKGEIEALRGVLQEERGWRMRAEAEARELRDEIRKLKSADKRFENLKAAVAGALTNLGSPDAMSGAAVSNQKAAARMLQDALVRANAKGPMDP